MLLGVMLGRVCGKENAQKYRPKDCDVRLHDTSIDNDNIDPSEGIGFLKSANLKSRLTPLYRL